MEIDRGFEHPYLKSKRTLLNELGLITLFGSRKKKAALTLKRLHYSIIPEVNVEELYANVLK